jgi:thiamine-phosphate pyrophosphorylase
MVERVSAASRAGVDLVQIRERDLDGGPLADLVRRCVRAVRSSRTRIIVNDRLDVALAAGAHGVHLRRDSFPASRVRTVVPRGFLVGRSVHDVAAARAATEAAGLDYLIFGSVFPTASKPGRAASGVDELAAVAAVTPLPVLAVGGVTLERIPAVAKTGAMGLAAIGLFADSPLERLGEIVDRIRQSPIT